MARIRTVKPEMWTDAKIVRLTPLARLLFIGSWNFADDYGALTPDAFQLKLQVLPTESADADELVDELLEAGLFEVLVNGEGVEFWHITNWNRHQRVNKPSDSQYGDPTTWKHPPTRAFTESPVQVADASGLNGKEGKGTEGNGMEVAPQTAQRERDPIWDTLVELFGEPSEQQRSLYGRFTKRLTNQRASPAEIRYRAGRVAELWGVKALTLASLEKHWSRFDSEVGQLTDAEINNYQAEVRSTRRLRALERGTS